VVGRNKRENEIIQALADKNDTVLRSVCVPGPTVLVSGELSGEILDIATAITVAYSDAGELDAGEIRIEEGVRESRVVSVKTRDKVEFRRYLI